MTADSPPGLCRSRAYHGPMSQVEIEYCEPCGTLGMAVEVRERLRESCGGAFDGVEFVAGDHGTFRVRVDGAVAYDTERTAYDPETVTEQVCAELS